MCRELKRDILELRKEEDKEGDLDGFQEICGVDMLIMDLVKKHLIGTRVLSQESLRCFLRKKLEEGSSFKRGLETQTRLCLEFLPGEDYGEGSAHADGGSCSSE